MLETIQIIKDNYDLNDSSLAKKIEINFRAIAGSRLSECSDCNGLVSGLNLKGSNVELTEELYLNALILALSDGKGSVHLTNDRAILLAKKHKDLEIVKTNTKEMSNWLLSEVGLEDFSSDIEEYEESTGELEPEDDEYYEDEEDEEYEDDEEYEEDEESTGELEEDSKDDFEEVKGKIKEYYYQFYKGIVNELSKRYTSLFESGYEVTSPAGILSKEGLVGLSGNSWKIKKLDVSIKKIYSIFSTNMDFIEVPCRSNIKIADTIYNAYSSGERRVLYFPNKLIEYAYGRKAPSGDNKESLHTYESHANSSNWNAYCKSEVTNSLMAVVGSSVVKFVYLTAEDGDYFNDTLSERLEDYLKYLQSCLSLCLLMVDYKSRKKGFAEDVYAFKIRICDPINSLGVRDFTQDIIHGAFAGSTGDDPFSYRPRLEQETMIKEYCHEFNHNSSQASPLFAYKAFLSLQNQGVEPNWNNMILGMFEDGTILKNGKHGVSLESRLTHHIDAGSRAGKGVMTLNILASGIYSKKALFYLDRKPDMASLLKNISPNMFVVNGGGYGEQYDTYGQFNDLDNLVNWRNVPDYVSNLLDVRKCWDSLGDLFYMRALKLVMAIIVARGDGQLENPKLGGNNGILLVVDEFKNFQESFSGIVEKMLGKLPPSSYLVDMGKMQNEKLKDYEKAKLMRDFELSYNNSSMYAITYLNSLVSDLEYLSTKRDAGFNQKEIELSDVFVIGQHLGHGSLDYRLFRSLIDDSSSSGRYKSSGKTGISSNASSILSKLGIQTASFPFSLVSFKTCDAFFGRNMEEGREVYLSQTRKESKAYGRLDDKASNFAYLNSFTEDTRKKIVGGNAQVNTEIANKCIYFKPFLVLNDAKPGDIYTEGMFSRCAGAGNEPGKEWVSREEIIAENPNSDGTFVNEAVGFEGYLNLMGAKDYSSVLAKSSEIANYVVGDCLGYEGTWFDFITDLRPQWCFTIKDIVDACKSIRPALLNVETNPVVSEFVRFNPQEFGLKDIDSFDGDDDSLDKFMDRECYSDYSDMGMQQAMVDVDMDSIFEDDYTGEDNIENKDDEINLFDDDLYTNIKESNIKETGFGSNSSVEDLKFENTSSDEIKELLRRLEELGVDIEYTPPTQSEVEYNNDLNYGSRSSTFCNGGYKEFESSDETEFNERLNFDGGIDSYAHLVNIVTEDVIKKFGGLDQIVSFKVIGGSIIVNGYYYRCKAGDIFSRGLPYDIRRELNAGNIDRLFNYEYLAYMPRLRDLEFDSTAFVYDYVSTALGYGSQISVDLFFRDFKALQCLCIGRKLFRRETYMEQILHDDVFYHPRTATKFANYSEEILGRVSNSSWEFTKNTFKSKQYGKVVKTLGVTGGVLATGASAGGKLVVKGSRKFASGLKNLGRSLLDMIDETKGYE